MKELSKAISRNRLYYGLDELKKFEAEKGTSIRNIPLGWFVKKYESGTIEPGLLEQKISDILMQGAESIPLWNQICKVVQMPTNKYEQPVMSYTDFHAEKGTTGSAVREAGGIVDRIELDCSGQNGLRRVKVAFDKTWIRDARWDAVEEAIRAASQSMYDEVVESIISEYETDVDSSMTDTVANWGNNHYKALVKAVSLIAAQQMYPDIILIHPNELYDLAVLDYFVHAQYREAAARTSIQPNKGLFGYLFPDSIPIYFHYKVTAGKMTVAASQKAVVLGIRQDLTIERFNDVLNGEEGAVLTMQWDVKSGKDAVLTKPTKKAWAVVTSA